MKQLNLKNNNMINYSFFAKCLATLILLFTTTLAKAQLDIDIDLNDNEWYEDPKVWIGVAVFLLILAFIARGKNR